MTLFWLTHSGQNEMGTILQMTYTIQLFLYKNRSILIKIH